MSSIHNRNKCAGCKALVNPRAKRQQDIGCKVGHRVSWYQPLPFGRRTSFTKDTETFVAKKGGMCTNYCHTHGDVPKQRKAYKADIACDVIYA